MPQNFFIMSFLNANYDKDFYFNLIEVVIEAKDI
jgi:hypothetical protein